MASRLKPLPQIDPGPRVAPAPGMGLNRAMTSLTARLATQVRMPSGSVALCPRSNNNNANNNNRTRMRVGDQA